MAQLMLKLIKDEGACCIFGYLMKHRAKTTKELADHLGVSTRAIRMHKKKIRDRECCCEDKSCCYFKSSSSVKPLSTSS